MKIKKLGINLALAFALATGVSSNILPMQSVINAKVEHVEVAYNYLKEIDKDYGYRIGGSEKEYAMKDYLVNKLNDMGYDAKLQEFKFTKKNKDYTSYNVIVKKDGKSKKEIIVGAHYDSVNTNGAGDNGSGVATVLEMAKSLKNKDLDYTIKFVFFGSEELGLQGSKAYVNAMSQAEIDNTILMVNLDSVLAGTYTYLYGGKYNSTTKVVEQDWAVNQGFEQAKKLNLPIKNNDTKLNYQYPSPTTGNWSDHAYFKNAGIAHIYLEASNWEVLDDENNPEDGSTGAAETEIGEVMHVEARDNLEFIEKTFGDRPKQNLKTFSTFLYNYLMNVDPTGLKDQNKTNETNKPTNKPSSKPNQTKPSQKTKTKAKYKKVKKGNTTYAYKLNKHKKYELTQKVFQTKKTKTVTNYKYYKNKKYVTSQKTTKKYKGKTITTLYYKKTYTKNMKLNYVYKYKKNNKNQMLYKYKINYKKGLKTKQVKYTYKNNKIKYRYQYKYNKKGQLKAKKAKDTIRYKTFYQKNKATHTYKQYYSKSGKLTGYYFTKLKVGF